MDNEGNANRWTERAEEIVSMARRHAAEIRSSAEHEADRVIQEAERRAVALAEAHIESNRQELDRMAALRRDIGSCLATAVSALERARVLSETRAEPASALPAHDVAAPVVSSGGPSSDTPEQESTESIPAALQDRRCGSGACSWWRSCSSSAAAVRNACGCGGARGRPARDHRESARAGDAGITDDEPEPSDLTVTVIANEECWVSTASDQDAPQERLLRPGDRIVVRADDVVTLRAGNAGALSVLINDQPAAPLGRDRQVVTRRITRANYSDLLLPPGQAANVPSAQ